MMPRNSKGILVFVKKIKNNIGSENYKIVEAPGSGRKYTVSIAIPASILEDTCLKNILRTYVVGQIARAATIYSIDEIVVYCDTPKPPCKTNKYAEMMKILLEYQECPQYLRKYFFEYDEHLAHVGVLNSLNAPHHLKMNEWCEYREGVVTDKVSRSSSCVDVGLPSFVTVDEKLECGLRVTVKLPIEAQEMVKPYGSVVSSHAPRTEGGFYWGYTVRVADSLHKVISENCFGDKYDLIIGTSENGKCHTDLAVPSFKRALIVFGGLDGLEAVLEGDENIRKKSPQDAFDLYVNTCPDQQTKTIRAEEAILISLCVLERKLAGNMK